ncbi:MAG: hypothetical protein WBF93_10145 [Pirellulales bacterium]
MTSRNYEDEHDYQEQPRHIPMRSSATGASRKRPDVIKKRPSVRCGIQKRRVRRIKW